MKLLKGLRRERRRLLDSVTAAIHFKATLAQGNRPAVLAVPIAWLLRRFLIAIRRRDIADRRLVQFYVACVRVYHTLMNTNPAL
jgi:hypothetical protein